MRLPGIVIAVGSLLTGVVTAAAPGAAAVSDVWTETSYANVFKDSRPRPSSTRTIELVSARNDREAAQLVVRKDHALTVREVTFTDLTSEAGVIGKANLAYQFVEYERLDENSTFVPGEPFLNTLRDAPAEFPDALSNEPTMAVPARTTQPVWIRVFAPPEAEPGVYIGKATLRTSTGDADVPIRLTVEDVLIPPAASGGFTTALWMATFGQDTWVDDPIFDYVGHEYGWTRRSPEWWDLMRTFARFMKEYRSNDYPVNMVHLLIDGGSRLDSNGHYVFDWSASDNWFDQFIPELKRHLEDKGWDDLWWMHIGDEPHTDALEESWNGLYDRVERHWPDVRIGDAMFSEPYASRLAGKVDVMIPNTLNYDEDPDAWNARLEPGKELWLYVCNIPAWEFLNRLIDLPAWHQRSQLWYAYDRQVTGYLHWGYNAWSAQLNGDPNEAPDFQFPKGDAWIVKPDKANNTLKATIRYEALRDGIEDWEVLNLLGKTRPDVAKALVGSVITDSNEFSRDTAHMVRTRALTLAAAGTPTGSFVRNDVAAGRPVVESNVGGQQVFTVDLGAQAQVDAVRVEWAASFARSYEVRSSYDGVTWSRAASVTGGNGGEDLVGTNLKARYLRIVVSGSTAALGRLQVAGFALPRHNLAGGRPYTRPTPNALPDSGVESVDGLLAGLDADGRSYGYAVSGSGRTVDVTIDLGTARQVSRVRTHPLENYGTDFGPDSVKVSVGTSLNSLVQKGVLSNPNDEDRVWYDVTFPATSARYVRVTFTKQRSGDANRLVLDEIEAYGP